MQLLFAPSLLSLNSQVSCSKVHAGSRRFNLYALFARTKISLTLEYEFQYLTIRISQMGLFKVDLIVLIYSIKF